MRHAMDYPAMGMADLIPALANFRTSLEHLSVQLEETTDILSLATDYPLPSVRKLSWRSVQSLDIRTVALVFPHLNDLFAIFYGVDSLFDNPMTIQHQQRNHEGNQWNLALSMNSLSGDVTSVWTLGICCHVDMLDLYFRTSRGTKHLWRLRSLLDDAQPYRLNFVLLYADDHPNILHPNWLACSSLKELKLLIHVDGLFKHSTSIDILVCFAAKEGLPLTCMCSFSSVDILCYTA